MTKPDGELTRLRDLEAAPGSTEAATAELVRAAMGGASPVGSKTRVRAALSARRAPGRAAWLRPVVVVSLLLVAGAGARAARGPGWMTQTVRRLVEWVAPRSPVAPQPEARPPQARAEAPSAPPASALPVAAELHAAPHIAHRAGHVSAAGGDDDEPTLVAAAVRALRRDHEAAHAAALLDEYLRRWPNGALAEEAMALSIEASQAAGGDGRTRALAVRYLQRFPSGRFVETAQRALVPFPAP
jgi:hypothetical protein